MFDPKVIRHFFPKQSTAEMYYHQYKMLRPDWEVHLIQGIKSGNRGWYVVYWVR